MLVLETKAETLLLLLVAVDESIRFLMVTGLVMDVLGLLIVLKTVIRLLVLLRLTRFATAVVFIGMVTLDSCFAVVALVVGLVVILEVTANVDVTVPTVGTGEGEVLLFVAVDTLNLLVTVVLLVNVTG